MKTKVFRNVCLLLLLAASGLPAHAQTTIVRQIEVTGPNRRSAARRAVIQTDGQGNANYQRTGAVNDRAGWSTTGSASYDPAAGYSGEATTTVNGQTYLRNTDNGTTTVTNPAGNSTVYPRPRLR